MKAILDTHSARALTSREIAKLISALLGGIAEFTPEKEL